MTRFVIPLAAGLTAAAPLPAQDLDALAGKRVVDEYNSSPRVAMAAEVDGLSRSTNG